MKKKIIIGGITIAVLLTMVIGYYAVFMKTSKEPVPQPQKDLTGIIVPPVTHSMKEKSFVVPGNDQVVSLNLVSPTSRYDYPMGRFMTASGTEGMLVAYDNFASAPESGVQVVPIAVTYTPGETESYLAVIDVTNGFNHIASLPIGYNATLKGLVKSGNTVTVEYAVFDRDQLPGEPPRVTTTAIFDINEKRVVQAGRDPRQEVVKTVKVFSGSYLWQKTVASDETVIAPIVPNVYAITFDANRINVTTDCNAASAEFVPPDASSTALQFSNLAATQMFCEKTQEESFFAMLTNIVTYNDARDGVLVFGLKDGGEMTFIEKGNSIEFDSSSDANSIPPDTPVASPS
jgi:heat shock protein HslJ